MIYGGIFDIEGKDKKVKDLETISEKGDFWDNQQICTFQIQILFQLYSVLVFLLLKCALLHLLF